MADIFRIISQRQTTDLTPDGRFLDVMEVTFETLPSQNTGTVTIPVAQYSAESVSQLVGDRAKAMIAVENL